MSDYERADDFLAALPLHPVDCLFLDFQMPGVTGLELLEIVVHRHLALPLIVVTAHDEPDARQRAHSLGAHASPDL